MIQTKNGFLIKNKTIISKFVKGNDVYNPKGVTFFYGNKKEVLAKGYTFLTNNNIKL